LREHNLKYRGQAIRQLKVRIQHSVLGRELLTEHLKSASQK